MSCKSVKVAFPESDVSTLSDLAKELARLYAWESWRVDDRAGVIVFEATDTAVGVVKPGYVGPSGFAFYLESDADDMFEELSPWEEYNVDWDEDFDMCNYVWGTDENGAAVMVHD